MNEKIRQLSIGALAVAIGLFRTTIVFAAVNMDMDRYYAQGIRYYKPNSCSGGSGSAVGGEAVISGSTAEEKVWSGLKSLGLTDEVTAGIMGNMSHESNHFNPVQHEGSWLNNHKGDFDLSGNEGLAYGLGLIQWSFGRRIGMYNYVKDHNASLVKYFDDPMKYSYANGSAFGVIGDKFIQLADKEADADALYSLELTYLVNEELKVHDAYGGVLNETTVIGAADYFLERVEKPANIEATRPGRHVTANEMFEKYAGKTSFAGGTGGNGNGAGRATTSAKNDGANVTWIGDSISVGALDFIKKKWSKADAVRWDNIQGRKTFDGGEEDNKSGQQLTEQYEIQGRMRDVLIFALGTNSPHLTEQTIKNMLQAAKTPKTIVMVTNYNRNDTHKYDSNNNLIRNAKNLDSRVVVADWEAAVRDNPAEYYDGGDDVHPNAKGSEYFVEVISRAAMTGYTASSSGDAQCNCDEISKTGTWANAEFELTDGQVAGLLAIIKDSAGSNLEAIKTEASYMINVYEDYNPNNTRTGNDFVQYVKLPVQSGGKFANGNKYNEEYSKYSQDEFNAVKDIWVNGNRTMPAGVIKRANDKEIISASNNGTEFTPTDHKKYKSGKTIIKQGEETWIFYKFTDDTSKKGDAYGYPEGGSPNQTSRSTSTSAGAEIVWSDDGWISGGLDGYYKDGASSWNVKLDDAGSKDFATPAGTGEGIGANKILLHSSESKGEFESTVKSLYAKNGGKTTAPHFTVDIKGRKVYQHYSVNKTASAIEDNDDIAGVQISVIGYTGSDTAGGEWNLRNKSNFSTEDWEYLVKLIVAVSERIGSKLHSKGLDWTDSSNKMDYEEMKSFDGIMGHMHAAGNRDSDPMDIWQFIEPILGESESGTGLCEVDDSYLGNLNETAIKLAWPDRGHSPDNPTEAYRQALLEPNGVGTRHQGDGCSIVGKSCDAFVATVLRYSGVDPDVPCCGAANMRNYLAASDKYTEVENNESTLRGGDIRASDGHIEMVVEVNGEKGIASASHCDRTGEIGGFYENSFRAFRFTGGK